MEFEVKQPTKTEALYHSPDSRVQTQSAFQLKFHHINPGPLKCLSAHRHQILAKSVPQKARNRDKGEFATKVRKSS